MAFREPGHETSLMYAIGRVNQGIRREMRDTLAFWNLSVQEYTTLSVLLARPGLSNAQLARRALITPQSMIELLKKLEVRGLIKRDSDPDHGLILRAELTPTGVALMDETDPAIRDIQERVFDGVSAKHHAVVAAAMEVAMGNLAERRRQLTTPASATKSTRPDVVDAG